MMKNKLYLVLSILISSTILFTSCDELFVEKQAGEDDVYLVSYEAVKVISQLEIDAVFAYLTTLYPDAEPIAEKVATGVRVYKITYNTIFQDESIVASGLVAIPIGTDEYSLLSFQNGTNTLHANAPTVADDSSDSGQLFLFLESIASTGFVVAIPDYIGFGETEDSFHPYLDKESTVLTVTDMLRAVKELASDLNFNLNDDLYITGYSMGGWATLATQYAIETDYSDEFSLKASACSAGPYDILFINSHILGLETYPKPYFISYMLNSYTKLGYITNDLSDIINEPYASLIPDLFDGTQDGDSIDSQLTTSIDDLFTDDYEDNYLTSSDFSSARLSYLNNSVAAWEITTPTALLHGEDDDFVTPQVSQNLYDDFINLGVSESLIQLSLIPGIDHPGGIIPCGIASLNWFLEIKDGE